MIDKFEGNHRWLSNFYLSEVEFEGLVYPSSENAYQAAKVRFSDRAKFTTCSPSAAKRFGRVADFPANWDSRKVDVMRKILQVKFAYGSILSAKLVLTGDQDLIEGNWWGDKFWGVCNGCGKNMLGKLLMEQREFLLKCIELDDQLQ